MGETFYFVFEVCECNLCEVYGWCKQVSGNKRIDMIVTELINSFRQFLNVSWSTLPDLLKDRQKSWDAIDDWYQTNWETIVETQINIVRQENEMVVLEIFGNGADCNGSSSRVFLPESLPTHCIKVNDRYRFNSFGTKYETGWFEITYPFDFIKVLDEDEIEIILSAENAKFSLEKMM